MFPRLVEASSLWRLSHIGQSVTNLRFLPIFSFKGLLRLYFGCMFRADLRFIGNRVDLSLWRGLQRSVNPVGLSRFRLARWFYRSHVFRLRTWERYECVISQV